MQSRNLPRSLSMGIPNIANFSCLPEHVGEESAAAVAVIFFLLLSWSIQTLHEIWYLKPVSGLSLGLFNDKKPSKPSEGAKKLWYFSSVPFLIFLFLVFLPLLLALLVSHGLSVVVLGRNSIDVWDFGCKFWASFGQVLGQVMEQLQYQGPTTSNVSWDRFWDRF